MACAELQPVTATTATPSATIRTVAVLCIRNMSVKLIPPLRSILVTPPAPMPSPAARYRLRWRVRLPAEAAIRPGLGAAENRQTKSFTAGRLARGGYGYSPTANTHRTTPGCGRCDWSLNRVWQNPRGQQMKALLPLQGHEACAIAAGIRNHLLNYRKVRLRCGHLTPIRTAC